MYSLVSLLLIPVAFADIGSTLSSVWWKILSVGNLSFLGLSDGSVVLAFVRLLIWILLFTVFFAVLTGLNGVPPMKYFSRAQSGVIAFVVATIGAVFLPGPVLAATGTGWATAIALLLIGGPLVGLGYLLLTIPGSGNDTKGTVMIKLALCLLMFWILSVMKYHVGRVL